MIVAGENMPDAQLEKRAEGRASGDRREHAGVIHGLSDSFQPAFPLRTDHTPGPHAEDILESIYDHNS